MNKRLIQMSKFLSLVLRHQPEKIGITLDSAGWVSVDELLDACQNNRFPMTKEELETIVAENDKRRFSFSEDGILIRANQGHSVSVALEYQAVTPPDSLYHGTIERFLKPISEMGLIKGIAITCIFQRILRRQKKLGREEEDRSS